MATHIQFGSLGDEVLDDLTLPVVRSVVQGVPTVGQLCVHIEPRLREGRGGKGRGREGRGGEERRGEGRGRGREGEGRGGEGIERISQCKCFHPIQPVKMASTALSGTHKVASMGYVLRTYIWRTFTAPFKNSIHVSVTRLVNVSQRKQRIV